MRFPIKTLLCGVLSAAPLVLVAGDKRGRADGHGGAGGHGDAATPQDRSCTLSLEFPANSLVRSMPAGKVGTVNAVCTNALSVMVGTESGQREGIGCGATGFVVGASAQEQVYFSAVFTNMMHAGADLGPCVVDGFINTGNFNTAGQPVGITCLGPMHESGGATLVLAASYQELNCMLSAV